MYKILFEHQFVIKEHANEWIMETQRIHHQY
jgi:hypothetical protein